MKLFKSEILPFHLGRNIEYAYPCLNKIYIIWPGKRWLRKGRPPIRQKTRACCQAKPFANSVFGSKSFLKRKDLGICGLSKARVPILYYKNCLEAQTSKAASTLSGFVLLMAVLPWTAWDLISSTPLSKVAQGRMTVWKSILPFEPFRINRKSLNHPCWYSWEGTNQAT